MRTKIITLILLCLAATMTAQNTMDNAIIAGAFWKPFKWWDTQNTAAAGLTNTMGVYPTNDIFYEFRLHHSMDIIISHCGSEIDDTYVGLMGYQNGSFISLTNSGSNSGQNGCRSTKNGYIHYKKLPVGTYYVYSKGKSRNGSIKTTIEGIAQPNTPTEYDLGVRDEWEGFTYTHTENTTIGAGDNPVTTNNDVYYKFTINARRDLKVTHKGTELFCTAITLIEDRYGNRNTLDFVSTGCSRPIEHEIFEYEGLPAGTYYIVSSGIVDNGEITTTIIAENPWWKRLGEKSKSFTYTHTADTRGGESMWNIYPNSDMFYEITTTKESNFYISNQGSELESTVISLIRKDDRSTSWLSSVNDPNNQTENFNWLEVKNLPPDTYVVIVEGVNGDGLITTTMEVEMNDVGGKDNYVRSRTYTYHPDSEYLDNYQYFNGLGYPVIGVQKGVTPGRNDLVSIQEYDEFGRETQSWLPVVVSDDNYTDFINIKSNARTKAMYNDRRPYTKPVYEDSPLNRVFEQYGPGQKWHDHERAVTTEYMVNNSKWQCHRYLVEDDTDEIKLSQVKMYDTGELYVTKVSDEENKNITYEFRNKSGQVLLTRQVEGGSTLNTYYVYDSYGNLRVVLPPLAVELLPVEDLQFEESTEQTLMAAALDTLIWKPHPGIKVPKDSLINIPGEVIHLKLKWDETSPTLQQYAYLYKYDHRNRCIAKKLPGCEWVYYIYDKKGRLIFSQDSEMRQRGEWLFNIPDALGRPVLTGVCKNNFTLTDHEVDKLVITANYTTGADSYKGYTVTGLTLFEPEILTVSYYDKYDFLSLPDFSTLQYETPEPGYGSRYTESSKGLLTGMYSAVAGNESALLASAMYYDDRARVIQTQSLNHTGRKESEYTGYNFVGQPLQTKLVHTANQHGQTTIQTELFSYSYDHAGRLLQVSHQLNNRPSVLLAENQYDELGRLTGTKVNGNDTLQTSFAYNVRSWIQKMETGNLFAEELTYTPSGNISQMQWSQAGDKHLYQYTYDDLSRLVNATYSRPATQEKRSSYSSAYSTAYGTSISNRQEALQRNNNTAYTYDKQGNIQTLMRYGRLSESSDSYGLVDNLTMSYQGNQLIQVINGSTSPDIAGGSSFKDFTGGNGEYQYNANGSLIKDSHKGIVDIQYNFLNLPQQIDIKSPVAEARNEYLYSATGAKLRVTQRWNPGFDPDGGTAGPIDESKLSEEKVTDYIGNKIYENGELKRILVPGGYYDAEAEKYNFYLSDHLGNNRVVVDEDGEVIQQTHYYPFGSTFVESTGDSAQPYKYNGKELDSKHGLNLYDYSARYYEPTIGRFTTVDPLAEKYYSISPYAYVANNPISRIDPDGREIKLSYEYEEDEEGNRILTGVTMHVTAKLLNMSSNSGVNMDSAAKRIKNRIENSYKGTVDKGTIKFKTEMDLQVASSMDDVAESDHLFVLVSEIIYQGKEANGVGNDYGGMVAFIDADYFSGPWDTTLGNKGPQTAGHEFGHLLNLRHPITAPFNLMKDGAGSRWGSLFFYNVTSNQLAEVISNNLNKRINLGTNYEAAPHSIPDLKNGGWVRLIKAPNEGQAKGIIKYY